MITQKFDKDLKEYFQKNKTEITDNGFSERVMQHLPVRGRSYWIISLSAVIGIIITYLLKGFDNFLTQFNRIFNYLASIKLPFINLTSSIVILGLFVLLIIYIDYEESSV